AAARGQLALPSWHLSTISTRLWGDGDATLQGVDARVAALAKDWLRTGPDLRVGHARVDASDTLAFLRADAAVARLPMQRQTVVAQHAGQANGPSEAASRLALSDAGWRNAARPSQRAAQSLHRLMRPVDAPWGRGEWTLDWIAPWSDLAP